MNPYLIPATRPQGDRWGYTLIGALFEYQALNSELNGFCSVKNGQVEAEISQCKVHRGCSIFQPNLRIKYGTLAHAQMLILVKKRDGTYAPVKVMPHLPPTGHRKGLDHFCVLIPFPPGIFRGLMTLLLGV